MAKKKDQKFVNLQPTSVMVPGPDGNRVSIGSWDKRHRNTAVGAIFVVEGEHYAKFVSRKGPLYPFPADAEEPPNRTLAATARAPKSSADEDKAGGDASAGGAGDTSGESGDPSGEGAGAAGEGDPSADDDASAGDDEAGGNATKAKAPGKGLKAKAKKKKKKS